MVVLMQYLLRVHCGIAHPLIQVMMLAVVYSGTRCSPFACVLSRAILLIQCRSSLSCSHISHWHHNQIQHDDTTSWHFETSCFMIGWRKNSTYQRHVVSWPLLEFALIQEQTATMIFSYLEQGKSGWFPCYWVTSSFAVGQTIDWVWLTRICVQQALVLCGHVCRFPSENRPCGHLSILHSASRKLYSGSIPPRSPVLKCLICVCMRNCKYMGTHSATHLLLCRRKHAKDWYLESRPGMYDLGSLSINLASYWLYETWQSKISDSRTRHARCMRYALVAASSLLSCLGACQDYWRVMAFSLYDFFPIQAGLRVWLHDGFTKSD